MRRLLALFLLLPTFALAEPGRLCRAAIATAEREAGIPPNLLAAIGRVESGRRDPATGAVHPWPWAINAEGAGQYLPSRDAALAEVRALQARGVRSIDVGCLQVNLRHHPNAFAGLEQAFDPLANARYAARFLAELHARLGDWPRAAGAYHSQTPEFGEPYRARILAAWAEEGSRPAPAAAPAPPLRLAAAPGAGGVPVGGGAFLTNGADRPPAATGRGLDAYRALPVPLAGRTPALLALLGR
jgi:soluble lytic murein transglycosylase-like protein